MTDSLYVLTYHTEYKPNICTAGVFTSQELAEEFALKEVSRLLAPHCRYVTFYVQETTKNSGKMNDKTYFVCWGK